MNTSADLLNALIQEVIISKLTNSHGSLLLRWQKIITRQDFLHPLYDLPEHVYHDSQHRQELIPIGYVKLSALAFFHFPLYFVPLSISILLIVVASHYSNAIVVRNSMRQI
jgi:hypothetical protein